MSVEIGTAVLSGCNISSDRAFLPYSDEHSSVMDYHKRKNVGWGFGDVGVAHKNECKLVVDCGVVRFKGLIHQKFNFCH